jgi:MFS family permease
MPLPVTLRALHHRNYRLFFGGQMVSLIGTWMQMVAQSWLVYRLTGSSVKLGAVGFCSQIPVLLLATVGGTVADRYPKHPIVVATQTISMLLAFVLAVLTFTGTVKIWHVFVMASLLGTVNAFDIPARQSFIVEMVGKTDLMNAIALNAAIMNLSRVVGPAIAGVTVALIGESWCFLLNGVSFLAVIAGLLLMRLPPRAAGPARGGPHPPLNEGFLFIRRHPAVLATLALLGTISFCGMPYSVLMPIFADGILHGGPRALGTLMGAAGLGAVAGTLMLASRQRVHGLVRWMAWAASVSGLALMAFSASRIYWLSFVLLIPVGGSMMVAMASTNTLVQSMVPDALRGRVMAVHTMMFLGMAPFGQLLAGAVASRIGVPLTVAAGGILCFAAASVFWMRLDPIHTEVDRLIALQHPAEIPPLVETVPAEASLD